MHGLGYSTRDISEQIEEIYGFEVSTGLVSKITSQLAPAIDEWHNRHFSPFTRPFL